MSNRTQKVRFFKVLDVPELKENNVCAIINNNPNHLMLISASMYAGRIGELTEQWRGDRGEMMYELEFCFEVNVAGVDGDGKAHEIKVMLHRPSFPPHVLEEMPAVSVPVNVDELPN